MEFVLNYIDSLSPFVQGILGSAVFAAATLFAQWLFKRAKQGGSVFLREYSKFDVVRHVLHRDYVNSRDIVRSSFGSSMATLLALRWMILGFLIAIFFIGVHSILAKDWLLVAAAWFCFNCFLEAHRWAKDSSEDHHISHVPDDLREEVIVAMYSAPEKEPLRPAEEANNSLQARRP